MGGKVTESGSRAIKYSSFARLFGGATEVCGASRNRRLFDSTGALAPQLPGALLKKSGFVSMEFENNRGDHVVIFISVFVDFVPLARPPEGSSP